MYLEDDEVVEPQEDQGPEDKEDAGAEEEEDTSPETPAGKQAEESEESGDDDSADVAEEVIVTIGDEDEQAEQTAQDTGLVRHLRRIYSEKEKENKKLKQQLEQVSTPGQPEEPGVKPTLESCDFDAEVFEKKLATWHERKLKSVQRDAQRRAEEEEQAKQWQEVMNSYGAKKSTLKVPDYDEAEAIVQSLLPGERQSFILDAMDNPAKVVYALGKNPKKLEELAKIQSHGRFIAEVAKLEVQLKVKPKRAPTKPEQSPKGSAPVTGAMDSTLEKLRQEAERTGDYTKVFAHRRKKEAAAGR